MIEISIHALLAESDCCARCHCWGLNEFLSTLSLRRATSSRALDASAAAFLSTLSLRRATILGVSIVSKQPISIHALLAESDYADGSRYTTANNFYPRSPCGERRSDIDHHHGLKSISIHALLAESDVLSLNTQQRHFPFLSTLSLRRATAPNRRPCPRSKNFYPRSPCGERPVTRVASTPTTEISIHALLAESDSKSAQNSGALLRIWNKFYGDCIFMLTGKAVFYPFCPCFFHIFWCEGTGNFMIAFPSH